MSAPEIQKTPNLYRGRPQPDPDERLAQIRIFLADEDYHRTLRFTQKLAEIEGYIAFLDKSNFEFDKQLLKRIKEMIGVHKNWIRRATQAPSTSYFFARHIHKNRLLSLVKDRKQRAQISTVKAPKLSQDLTPGPPLHKCMERADKPASPDPFLYTKQLAEIRRRQDAEAKRILNDEQSAVLQGPIPTNFNGPYTPFYKLTTEDITERRSILSETLKRLNEAAALAPRPFIYEILEIITDSIQDGRDGALEQLELSLTNEDLQRLLTLAEPSWNSDVKRAMRSLSDDGAPESAMFAHLMELFNSDLWPDRNSEATLAEVFNRFSLDADGGPMTIADLETFLVEMNEIGSIRRVLARLVPVIDLIMGRYDATSQLVRKPLLDQHPEDGLPQELYRTAAQRFGYTAANLESLLEDEDSNGDRYILRDTNSILWIKQQVEAKYPLLLTAPGPSEPKESLQTKEKPARLLQRQAILEQYHNWNDRAPNFRSLWAFASPIKNPKQFFALDRWPLELQTEERRNEIRQSGPARPSPERNTEDEEDFPRPKENETFYPGETFFPFGETPYHEALLARQIDLNRPDGTFAPVFSNMNHQLTLPLSTAPVHPPPYIDQFALPELSESETPALMEYAAGLGLGKRKRPIEDDASAADPHANKTVPISDPNAPGVPNITAEQMAAFSYPTPQFSPETIGGVEMRVAESPAGRGRRHVRFNSPRGVGYGGSGITGSSESSGGLTRGLVRPMTEPGWFGPKLVAKPGGNGGRGGRGGSGGNTGSAGNAIGGGQRRPRAASSSSDMSSEGGRTE